MIARLILSRHPCAWARHPGVAIVTVLVVGGILTTIHNPLALPVLFPLGFFLFIVAAANRIGGVVANRGAYVLGECSFGIYMLHGIVLHVAFSAAQPMLAGRPFAWIVWLYPVAVILVALVSFAAFLFVEAPAIAVGRRAAMRLRPARPAETAAPAVDGMPAEPL
ncbi:hypothetical protein [Sphingomonas sp. CARO-RG-8B-R24-01]|uniref:hypothetical protein n=1 Tax=Sphingomonas sp. CARO-RG-8B-R24-01 TaxID=2914831 RepID=UPI001F59688D|nr:hypothetical protein [Sphingomonas sp. CARO-RG-8B-R24-01]